MGLLRATPTGWYGFEGAPDLMKLPGELRYDLPERSGASRVEGGMYDIAAMAGLAAALGELASIGIGTVAERVSALTHRLGSRLTDLGYSLASPRGRGRGSGIVSLRCAEPGGRGRRALRAAEPGNSPAGVAGVIGRKVGDVRLGGA